MSHLILPHESVPPYGKIQVGVYIAAIRDAIDRVRQDIKKDEEKRAEASRSPSSKDDQNKGPDKDKDDDDDPEEGPESKRRRGDPPAKDANKKKGGPSTARRGRTKHGRGGGKFAKTADQVRPRSAISHAKVLTVSIVGPRRDKPRFHAFLLRTLCLSSPRHLHPQDRPYLRAPCSRSPSTPIP
jgi:hypothetical protein